VALLFADVNDGTAVEPRRDRPNSAIALCRIFVINHNDGQIEFRMTLKDLEEVPSCYRFFMPGRGALHGFLSAITAASFRFFAARYPALTASLSLMYFPFVVLP